MAPRRIPVVSGKVVIKALHKAGFELRHIRGSHHVMVRRDQTLRLVSVPVHGNRPIKTGTLAAILEQAGLSAEDFEALL